MRDFGTVCSVYENENACVRIMCVRINMPENFKQNLWASTKVHELEF